MKIQNDKLLQIPDPFSLDWDNLSETELKRLVGQLEKTRSDLKSDLREVQWRLDKERTPSSVEFLPDVTWSLSKVLQYYRMYEQIFNNLV